MKIKKEISNILVGLKGDTPAKTFQGYKSANKARWGLDAMSKKTQDEVIKTKCIAWAKEKQRLRDLGKEKAIKLLGSAVFTDLRIQEKEDAKGKKHFQINGSEKPVRIPKVVTNSMNKNTIKSHESTIASLKAKLASLQAKPTTQEGQGIDMANLVTA